MNYQSFKLQDQGSNYKKSIFSIIAITVALYINWLVCDLKCFDFYWGLMAMAWAPVVFSYLLTLIQFIDISRIKTSQKCLIFVVAALLANSIAFIIDFQSSSDLVLFYIALFLPSQIALVLIIDLLLYLRKKLKS